MTNSPESRSFLLLQLIIVAGLIFYACFWRLGEKSVTHYDEYVTMRAIQGIVDTGEWWRPSVDGETYLRKPPFKMWLTLIPLHFFGQSNFSFRFIDALAGAGTVLLVFFFSRSLLGLWGVGLLSALALLGCKAFVLEHCVRNAVHDSLLTFLSTAALVCGWKYFQGLLGAAPPVKSRRWLYLCAASVSCAVLTKSIAGFFPIVILGTFAVIDKELLACLRRELSAIAIVFLIALAFPGLYFVYHFVFTDGAWGIMIKHEVVRRIRSGFHHRNSPFFYVRGLLVKNKFVPSLLFIAGMLWSAFQWFVRRNRSHLLVLNWAVLPILLFSFIPSRLFWYLAPSFPGMAILVGALCAKFFDLLESCTREHRRSGIVRAVCGVLSIACVVDGVSLLAENYALVVLNISHRSDTLPIDQFVNELFDLQSRQNAVRGGPVIIDRVHLSYADDVYFGMLGKNAIHVRASDSLEQLIEAHPTALVVTGVQKAGELLRAEKFSGYGFFRAEAARPQSLAILSKSTEVQPYPVTSLTQVYHFGTDDVETLYGFAAARSEKKRLVRDVIGKEAAFLLPGNRFLRDLGAELIINAKLSSSAATPALIEVVVNQKVIGEFSPESQSFKYFPFTVGDNILLPGRNIVVVRTKNSAQGVNDNLLMLEKVRLTLNTNSAL